MDHMKNREPLESANCTTPPLPINKATLSRYNCTNITDIIHAINLYYDAKDVFGGINISAIPPLPTPPVITTHRTTSGSHITRSSQIDLDTIKEQSNRTLNPNMTLEKVNELATQLEVVVNSSETDTKVVTQILSHMSEVEITNSETVETFSRISTTVIHTYNETLANSDSSEIIMPNILYSMENVLSSASPNENISMETSEMDISVSYVERNLSNGDIITISSIVGTIVMPITVFDGETSRVSTIIYKTINQKWSVKKGYNYAKIGSNVMSVSVQNINKNQTEKAEVNVTGAITIVLPTNVTGVEKERFCTFWNFQKRYWDTYGGTVVEKNDTHTKCRYDHLTNLAVLVLYYKPEDPMTKEHQNVLYIMTTLGCSISIACLALTLIIYVYLRVLSNDTVLIHANLSIALMLGQLVLVTSDGAAKYMAACKIVTALLHYLFMSAFAWMMVEGLALYLSCTRPISAYGDMRMIYSLIGWGLPAIIVLITLGSNFQDYGEGEYSSCWLSIDDGLIWSFVGPMIAIVVMNIVVLGLVLKAFLTLRTNSRKTEAARLFASFKVMVTLLPILGVTWLLGILVPLSHVFHYFFIIGTSMQGTMIFFLHCLCNNVVRKKYNERRRRNTCSSSDAWFGSSSAWTERRQHRLEELKVVPKRYRRQERYAWM
ncbi:adhesion G-protein coupled receptor D1-like [Saccostrea echinata]|uniref:adhesion G-protein coupled receptor D1-like n=1 Tax=Saccostrea echinata TaxID=191078 RepID=UPI002A8013E8|nr:adhesion G-protein coupled receptor D1-like [Saccostrea echinata]